jgi:hypothetical protein
MNFNSKERSALQECAAASLQFFRKISINIYRAVFSSGPVFRPRISKMHTVTSLIKPPA